VYIHNESSQVSYVEIREIREIRELVHTLACNICNSRQVHNLTADLTFYADGSVKVRRDEIAQFCGVSEGDVIRYAISKPEALRVEHESFLDAVLGKDADIVTLPQGMITVVVAEATIESARTGQTITLGN
jgi:predicted dehydrogenase